MVDRNTVTHTISLAQGSCRGASAKGEGESLQVKMGDAVINRIRDHGGDLIGESQRGGSKGQRNYRFSHRHQVKAPRTADAEECRRDTHRSDQLGGADAEVPQYVLAGAGCFTRHPAEQMIRSCAVPAITIDR